MRFKVEIKEVLSRIIEIDAESENEAISIVNDMYNNEEVILSADDFVSKDIEIINE